jgi:hypothetical protein
MKVCVHWPHIDKLSELHRSTSACTHHFQPLGRLCASWQRTCTPCSCGRRAYSCLAARGGRGQGPVRVQLTHPCLLHARPGERKGGGTYQDEQYPVERGIPTRPGSCASTIPPAVQIIVVGDTSRWSGRCCASGSARARIGSKGPGGRGVTVWWVSTAGSGQLGVTG